MSVKLFNNIPSALEGSGATSTVFEEGSKKSNIQNKTNKPDVDLKSSAEQLHNINKSSKGAQHTSVFDFIDKNEAALDTDMKTYFEGALENLDPIDGALKMMVPEAQGVEPKEFFNNAEFEDAAAILKLVTNMAKLNTDSE